MEMVMVDGTTPRGKRRPPVSYQPGQTTEPGTGYRLGNRVLQGQHAEFCRVPERAVRRAAARAAARAGEESILTAFRRQMFGGWRVIEPKPWGWLVWTGNLLGQDGGTLDLTDVVVIDPQKATDRRRSDRIRHTMVKGPGLVQRPTALSGSELMVAALTAGAVNAGAVPAFGDMSIVACSAVGLVVGWMALVIRQLLLEKDGLRRPRPAHPAVRTLLAVEAASHDPRFAAALAPLLPSIWQLIYESAASRSDLPAPPRMAHQHTRVAVAARQLEDAIALLSLTRQPLRADAWSARGTDRSWFSDDGFQPHNWSHGDAPVEEIYGQAIAKIQLYTLQPSPTAVPLEKAPSPIRATAELPPTVEPLSPDLLTEAVTMHAEVETEWAQFCADPYSIFIRPLINDVTEPATAAFFERREAAEQLAPLAVATPTASRTAEYHQAVLNLSDAWAAADTNARSVGFTRMDTATKRTLNRARSVLNRALDERTPAGERRICCNLIVQLLRGAGAVPESARNRLIHQLETVRPQLSA